MLPKEKLDRINELANKSKSEGLTEAEKTEQKKLRSEYLKTFRKNFTNHLHQIKVVDEEGTDVTPDKLKESKRRRNKH